MRYLLSNKNVYIHASVVRTYDFKKILGDEAKTIKKVSKEYSNENPRLNIVKISE